MGTMDHEQVMVFLKDFGIAAGLVAGQALAIIIIWFVIKRFQKRIAANAGERIKPLVIKKLRVLSVKQITEIITATLHIIKYIITFVQLLITIPFVFKIFPQTEHLADSIFGYILTPLKNIFHGIISYIPNLITIIIILLITKYALRGLKFFSTHIAKEKLKIPGFYPEWANPTFNILKFLIYAFTLAVVFPYLPGSDSRVFQGVSVFVGIIFSLGSSTAIGNLVAGLVITYMRPFKIGDRIQIQGYTGFVVEKHLMVIRIKTHKNEYITFPNIQVLSGSVINYNTSSDEDEEGLILNAKITYNYAAPWRLIHEILIEAALKTTHIQKTPKPFVLQTSLDDNYASYQINCYTKTIEKIPAIYAGLFENIQDAFASRGMDMTAPEFKIILPPESRGEGPLKKK
ncbi:MAG: mechanosensitive ion channel family protein [Treponema sp.]|jgi:small-conductance mechanosensitive channel|nr:mechanosensitive ion channel family protein [Treponema sp.]